MLCSAGLGAGTVFAQGAPTSLQLSLNDQYRACLLGCDAQAPVLAGDLRTAVWTVVEGGPGPDPDSLRPQLPGPHVTPVVAQIPYTVTGDVTEPGYGGQAISLDAAAPVVAPARGEGEQPQGLPRALFAALIALIGIVAVARRGMSRKD